MQHITPEDYLRLAPLFNGQWYQLSIYSLPSIIAWSNQYYQPVGLVQDDTLIVAARFSAGRHTPHLILPVSPSRTWTPQELYDLARQLRYERYRFVSENYLDRYKRQDVATLFEIEAQPAFEDYVYYQADLAQLKGNRYAGKRNLIRQFERQHLTGNRVTHAPMRVVDSPECLDFLERWCEEQDCDVDRDKDLACEWQAAINMINNVERFEVNGLVLRIDGIVSAFAVASRLTTDMGVLHFEKASTRVKGLYQYFDRLCARELFAGCTYINKESDMELDNLARAKKSYHPCLRVQSYMLTLKR